jgi:hypothetical protein
MRFKSREFEWTGFDWPGLSVVVEYTNNLITTTEWISKHVKDQKHVKDRVYFDCEFDKKKLGLVQLGVPGQPGVPGQVLIVDVASNINVMEPIQELFWENSVQKIGFAITEDMKKLQSASASYAWTLKEPKATKKKKQQKWESTKKKKQQKWKLTKIDIQQEWKTQWGSVQATDLQELLGTRLKGSPSFKLLQKTYLRKDNACAQQPIRLSECKDPTNPPDPLKTEFKLTEYASLVFPMELTKKLNQSKLEHQQTRHWTEKDSKFDLTEIQYAASDVVILFYLHEFVVALPQLSISVLHKRYKI